MRGASVEQGRGGMREVSLGHEIVSLNDTINIGAMNSNRNTHNHMLWTFSNASINAEEVRPFQCFETKAKVAG